MSSDSNEFLDFSLIIPSIQSKQVWVISPEDGSDCCDPPQAMFDALQNPADFPPLESAIVPGDRVALAVDPNVPMVSQIVLGAIKAIGLTEADAIDVVLGDEATSETVDAITEIVGDKVNVVVHQSSERGSLRYIAADVAADPIYLNRYLVDADLVLPIVTNHLGNADRVQDLTRVFPAFADSASRYRFQSKTEASENATPETAWQLGIHLMVTVSATKEGRVSSVIAETPFGAQQRLKQLERRPAFPEKPTLVVVSLDGDRQHQTWVSAARAVRLAAGQIESGGTIVVWTEIDSAPSGQLLALGSEVDQADEPDQSADGFPAWDDSAEAAQIFERFGQEYRLMVHSRVDRESIESIGLGVVGSVDELSRLSASFESCGVIRAAQFGTAAACRTETHAGG